jgi:hypothetical protein
MSRADEFAAMAAKFPRNGPSFLVDLTPPTDANQAGYLTGPGDVGPWIKFTGNPEHIHVEARGGDGTSQYTVVLDLTNDLVNTDAYIPDRWISELLGAGAPAGDGVTVAYKGWARLRVKSASGTPANISATSAR